MATTDIRPTDDLLLSIFVRDDSRAIQGGIFGCTWGCCCEIRYLWVDEAWRGRGYGQGLLVAAEQEARRRGCHRVILATYSFQAPKFYQRNGYEVVGMIENYPEGHQKFYLLKKLI